MTQRVVDTGLTPHQPGGGGGAAGAGQAQRPPGEEPVQDPLQGRQPGVRAARRAPVRHPRPHQRDEDAGHRHHRAQARRGRGDGGAQRRPVPPGPAGAHRDQFGHAVPGTAQGTGPEQGQPHPQPAAHPARPRQRRHRGDGDRDEVGEQVQHDHLRDPRRGRVVGVQVGAAFLGRVGERERDGDPEDHARVGEDPAPGGAVHPGPAPPVHDQHLGGGAVRGDRRVRHRCREVRHPAEPVDRADRGRRPQGEAQSREAQHRADGPQVRVAPVPQQVRRPDQQAEPQHAATDVVDEAVHRRVPRWFRAAPMRAARSWGS